MESEGVGTEFAVDTNALLVKGFKTSGWMVMSKRGFGGKAYIVLVYRYVLPPPPPRNYSGEF